MQIEIENPYKKPNTHLINIAIQLNSLLNLNIDHLYLHIISDEELLNINQQFLNHDYYTDIITFDLRDEDSNDAEIFISLERVIENAITLNISPDEELHRVLIHGLLHLSGIDDKTRSQKIIMRKLELKYLNDLFHVKPI